MKANAMRKKYQDVREFHETFGFPAKDEPDTLMNPDDVHLRKALVREEHRETQDALEARDVVETADGLADLHYIVTGTAISLGLDPDAYSHMVASTMLREGTQRLLSALEETDHAEAARAVLRTEITIYGIAAVLGIPHDQVWAEVHRSNMDKRWPDGKTVIQELGEITRKVMKPPGWKAPDVRGVLEQAGRLVAAGAPVVIALFAYFMLGSAMPAEAFF